MMRAHTKPEKDNLGLTLDPFANVLPPSMSIIVGVPKRYKIRDEWLKINVDDEYKKSIYTVVFSALSSEWYASLGDYSCSTTDTVLRHFIPWLNEQELSKDNKLLVLKNYEAKRVNEDNVKTQSSGLNLITNLMKRGLRANHISDEIAVFINVLLQRSTPAPKDPVVQRSLSSFFASMPWLREVIGERDYLKLESPKRLSNSFSISIATTLLFIVEQKEKAKRMIGEECLSRFSEQSSMHRSQIKKYCRMLFLKICAFDENCKPLTDLTELVKLDIVDEAKSGLFEDFLRLEASGEGKKNGIEIGRVHVFSHPDIFASTASWSDPSRVEQILFSWLCAWMTVQPYDIKKLTTNDFVISKNKNGKNVSLQCVYYKSRSDREQQPFMLPANHVEAQAVISYIEQYSCLDRPLVLKQVPKVMPLNFGNNTVSGILARLLQLPAITKEIKKNLLKRDSSAIFMRAFTALYEKGVPDKINSDITKENETQCLQDSKLEPRYLLIPCLFWLSFIKNSSIHSRSDEYREGDLVNGNSHTPEVEKLRGLTPDI